VTRIAVIGAGSWGINHVRVLARERRCSLVAVVDSDPKTHARVRGLAPEARCVVDPDVALCDPEIDAVVIATPAPTHAALARTALEHGKHVLVEKPLALSFEDARMLVAARDRANRVGMVGHLMVYHPGIARLRDLLRSGVLGTLHYLYSSRVNLGRIRHDESALWSFGPHDLSMIDHVLGAMPASVTARGQSALQSGIEDVVFLTLRYASGEIAHIQLSWLSPRKERRLTLVCSQKMVEFDDVSPEKLRIYDKGYDRPPEFTEFGEYLTLRDGDVHLPQIAMAEPLQLELQHFLTCIETGARPISDFASGLRVTQVLAAAQRSLAGDGIPVTL
jgi:predicted dehydrogenase